MYRLLLIALLVPSFFLSKSSFGQVTDPEKQPQVYLDKWKRQKKTGWILLGSGVTSLIVGTLLLKPFDEDDPYGILSMEEDSNGGAAALAILGSAAAVASIPFFISAGKNRKKAAALSLVPGSIKMPQLASPKLNHVAMKLTVAL